MNQTYRDRERLREYQMIRRWRRRGIRAGLAVLALAALCAFYASSCQAQVVSLTFTLPNTVQGMDSSGFRQCIGGGNPLSDLSRWELWGAPQWGSLRKIADLDVSGQEGQRKTYLFDTGGFVWTVKSLTRRAAIGSRQSCWSNQIGLNMGPGIPDPAMDAQP